MAPPKGGRISHSMAGHVRLRIPSRADVGTANTQDVEYIARRIRAPEPGEEEEFDCREVDMKLEPEPDVDINMSPPAVADDQLVEQPHGSVTDDVVNGGPTVVNAYRLVSV